MESLGVMLTCLRGEGGRKFQARHEARNLKLVFTAALNLEGANANGTATRQWLQDSRDQVLSLGTEVLEPMEADPCDPFWSSGSHHLCGMREPPGES